MKTLTASQLTGKSSKEQRRIYLEATKDLSVQQSAEIAKRIELENNEENYGDVLYAENLVYILLLSRKHNLDFSFEFGNMKELRKLNDTDEIRDEAKRLTA